MQNRQNENEQRSGIERRWIKVPYGGTEKRTGKERRYIPKEEGILHHFDVDNHLDEQ